MPAIATHHSTQTHARPKAARLVGTFKVSDSRLTNGYTPTEIKAQLLESLIIERYKKAELSLGEVAEILGLYPNTEAASQWLFDRGVVQAFAPGERARSHHTSERIYLAAKARLANASQL